MTESRSAPLWKPTHAAAKKAKRATAIKRQRAEQDSKAEVRRRDERHCRFPLCGCRWLNLRLEVSHDQHKGIGGNPAGDRSTADRMILLCVHRHQHGIISRHKGTLQTRYLSGRNNDGPVAWLVDLAALKLAYRPALVADLPRGTGWFEVARERAVQRLEPLTAEQRAVLDLLADMDL